MAKKDKAGLIVERVALEQLKEFPGNPMRHEERNLDAIRRSLVRFGQVDPLVVRRSTNEVLSGNGRIRVMRDLGWDSCDVVFVEVADDNAAKALVVSLNKTGLLAEFDYEALSAILRDLQTGGFDLLDTGFADFEIEPLLHGLDVKQSAEVHGDFSQIRYQIVVQCHSEQEQLELLNRFTVEGIECRALIS